MDPTHTTHLRGSLVRLTALGTADAEVLVASQDSAVMRLLDTRAAVPSTVARTREWIEREQKNPNSFHFAIRRREDDALIGFCELDGIEWNNGACGLGIGLSDPANWGKGFGREAMELLLRFAFHELNLHRVGLTVFSYNERAIALYESLGFVREGTERERLHRDGKRYGMHTYGLLRREWQAQAR